MALANLCHVHGTSFGLASSTEMQHILELAKKASTKFVPPNRNKVSGSLLSSNYDAYMKRVIADLRREGKIYGILYYGDGCTVKKMALTNFMAAGAHISAATLEIHDSTKHLSDSKIKDGKHIAEIALPHIAKMENLVKDISDVCFFDGAGNVQNAGSIISVHYPRMMTLPGAEHVISLFARDVFQL